MFALTAQGSPYTRLRRALDHGNPVEALSAAGQLQDVALSDALELVLLLAQKDPARCRRAALRWHGRYTREHRDVEAHEAQAVLALLAMLTGLRNRQAAMALAELLDRPGLRSAQEALVRWAGRAA